MKIEKQPNNNIIREKGDTRNNTNWQFTLITLKNNIEIICNAGNLMFVEIKQKKDDVYLVDTVLYKIKKDEE